MPCGSPQLSEQMNVTLVTANAAADELSADDYREMFDELKQGHSLSQLVALIGSQFSRALWNQYEQGRKAAVRPMRNELRGLLGWQHCRRQWQRQPRPHRHPPQSGMVGDGVPDTG